VTIILLCLNCRVISRAANLHSELWYADQQREKLSARVAGANRQDNKQQQVVSTHIILRIEIHSSLEIRARNALSKESKHFKNNKTISNHIPLCNLHKIG
jgi:hypothetical protein